MKVELTKKGEMKITAENSTEQYALGKWEDDNKDVDGVIIQCDEISTLSQAAAKGMLNASPLLTPSRVYKSGIGNLCDD